MKSKSQQLIVSSSETIENITKSLEDMIEGCEQLDFPQIRHDFSDTKMYWRNTSNKPSENASVETSEKPSEKTSENTSEKLSEMASVEASEKALENASERATEPETS